MELTPKSNYSVHHGPRSRRNRSGFHFIKIRISMYHLRTVPLAVWLSILLAWNHVAFSAPLDSAFLYQGHLRDNGSPANGNYDLQFGLYTSSTEASQVGDL